MSNTLGSINPRRDRDYNLVVESIGTKEDQLDEDISRRRVKKPYYSEPIVAQGGSSPAYGLQLQQYTIPRGTGLYSSSYDTFTHHLSAVTLSGPAPSARYCDGYGLAMIGNLEFRVGGVSLCNFTKYSLYMYMQMQNVNWRSTYLNAMKFGGTHDAAELALPQEVNVPVPGPFEPIENTLRTNKMDQAVQYILTYANASDLITTNAPGVTITTAPISMARLTSLCPLGDRDDPAYNRKLNTPDQRLNVTTYRTQDITIGAGAARWSGPIRWTERVRKVLFYLSSKALEGVAPNQTMEYFKGLAIKQFKFKINGMDFPSNGFQTAGYNSLVLSDVMGVSFDTNIYGWNFGYQFHNQYEDNAMDTSIIDGMKLQEWNLEIEFNGQLANDYELHILYECDKLISVDSGGNLQAY